MSGRGWEGRVHRGVLAIGGAFLAVLAISSFQTPTTVGGTPATSGSATAATPPTSHAALSLGVEDFRFVPATLAAAPGAVLSLTVRNTGAVTHSFSADSPRVSEDIPPGETRTVTLTAPAKGGIAFYCRFHPGMQGSITIGTATPGG